MFFQSFPCQSKGNKSKALQMSVLSSCNVTNPQGFWMVASFFDSWVLMCMFSWWALGHLINSLHLVFSHAALFQELHAAYPNAMSVLWLFYWFKWNTARTPSWGSEISPVEGSYGFKIELFARAWPMKRLSWSKKFNVCYTLSSLRAGAGWGLPG